MEQANDSDGREEAVAEKTTKRENAVPTKEEAPEYTEPEPTPIWISRRTRIALLSSLVTVLVLLMYSRTGSSGPARFSP